MTKLLSEFNIIWSSFFRGQLLLSFTIACIVTGVGFIIGLPFSLLMGILAGNCEFRPSIGNAIWIVIASTLALFMGSTWIPIRNWSFFLILLVLHILITQFDLNYLISRIIGRLVRLPPVVVNLGILIGASLAGVLGVALAAPTIASMRVLSRYVYARLADQDTFPEQLAYRTLPAPEIRI